MPTYRCAVCGEIKDRDELTAKRVSFQTMGRGFRTLKSKVVAWLCKDCREKDPAWLAPKWQGSPGHVDSNFDRLAKQQ